MERGTHADAKEFSADEIGTRTTMTVACILYCVLSCFCLYLRNRLRMRRKFHHTAALLCWSIWIMTLGVAFSTGHVASFASDGKGAVACQTIAQFLWHVADLILVLLVILLAKGWTIVRKKISANGRVRLTLYMTTLVWATMALELWRTYVYNPAIESYYAESPPGLVLAALRALVVGWFWSDTATLQNHSDFFRLLLTFFF